MHWPWRKVKRNAPRPPAEWAGGATIAASGPTTADVPFTVGAPLNTSGLNLSAGLELTPITWHVRTTSDAMAMAIGQALQRRSDAGESVAWDFQFDARGGTVHWDITWTGDPTTPTLDELLSS